MKKKKSKPTYDFIYHGYCVRHPDKMCIMTLDIGQ